MSTAFEQLVRHFEQHKLTVASHPENEVVIANFDGQAGSYRIVAHVSSELRVFQVFGFSPIVVPEGSRTAIAEAIARANYKLILGKFELDLGDGELRFHVAHLLTADTLEDETIARIIGVTLQMLDRYMPAFLSVIYGNELPRAAVGHVEASRG